jgi:hypothetical protein
VAAAATASATATATATMMMHNDHPNNQQMNMQMNMNSQYGPSMQVNIYTFQNFVMSGVKRTKISKIDLTKYLRYLK